MTIKKEYIILFLIIIALSLYLFFHNPDKTNYQMPKIPLIAENKISKIEITMPDRTLIINKDTNNWKIAPENFPANINKVKSMLKIIKNFTLTAFVSKAKSYERYDLTDNKITVKAWENKKPVLEFSIGKTAPSYQHTFVKLDDNPNVYHAKGTFKETFNISLEDLRDKIVFAFKQNDIFHIQIKKGKQEIVLNKKQIPVEIDIKKSTDDDKSKLAQDKTKLMMWESSDGRKCSELILNNMFSTLSELKCEKYISGSKKEDCKKPAFTVLLKGQKQYMLNIFDKKDENNYSATSSENSYPFLLSKKKAEDIMKKIDELIETK